MNRKRMFQHAAARRRLGARSEIFYVGGTVSTRSRPKAAGIAKTDSLPSSLFQHAAARRRLDDVDVAVIAQIKVSTRSRPKAAGLYYCYIEYSKVVSTRSRPKAAGVNFGYIATAQVSFNTQPPEGGWPCALIGWQTSTTFQHAAARRRLGSKSKTAAQKADVSTRSRPKAAGVCDRTQLFQFQVSTRSRPKAAGLLRLESILIHLFQHAAARRRLVPIRSLFVPYFDVSTRSRPKAAGRQIPTENTEINSFNTQPPEGGWKGTPQPSDTDRVSTRSRPKAAGI